MKKFFLIVSAFLILLCAVSCNDVEELANAIVNGETSTTTEGGSTPSQQKKTLEELVYEASDNLYEDTEFSILGNFGSWDNQSTLHEVLSMYSDYAYDYATNKDAWDAALNYFRHDMLENYPDVFGLESETKAIVPQSLKTTVDNANKLSLEAVQIVLNLAEVYDKYLDDEGLDKIEMLLNDKISVAAPKFSYDKANDTMVESGYYPLIMDKVAGSKQNTFVYTFKEECASYYKWSNSSEASCTVSCAKPSGSGTTTPKVTATITLKDSNGQLKSNYKYLNSLYTFSYAVELPENSTATVSCAISSTNNSILYKYKNSDTTGRFRFKNPGKYTIKITVSPGVNEAGCDAKVQTFTVRINDPFTDVLDEYQDKIIWAFATPLVTILEECLPEDLSSIDYLVDDFLTVMVDDEYVSTAKKAYQILSGEADQVLGSSIIANWILDGFNLDKNFLYEGLSAALCAKINTLSSVFDQDFTIVPIEGTKNSLKKYESIDSLYYQILDDTPHEGDTNPAVYSYLELFAPLYLKDIINNLNSFIKKVSLISGTPGVLYSQGLISEGAINYSSVDLNLTSVYTLFTGKKSNGSTVESVGSLFNNILNTDMPYPYITNDIKTAFSTASAADVTLIAEFMNILNLIEEPTKLLKNDDLLDDVNLLVDLLQTAVYFCEHVYHVNEAGSAYEFEVPQTITGIASMLIQFGVIDIEDIPGYENTTKETLTESEINSTFTPYYEIRTIVDNAIAAVKNAVKLEITTIF